MIALNLNYESNKGNCFLKNPFLGTGYLKQSFPLSFTIWSLKLPSAEIVNYISDEFHFYQWNLGSTKPSL